MAAQELKVLLIEDNPGDAFLIKFYLGESAAPIFHVSHAETVKAGLQLLAENKFDIILSDMNLPDSFGMDTIKTIVSNYPGNLVMVLTGLTDEEVGLETVRYGAQDFLVKGKFDGKVLISSVLFAFERFKLNTQIDLVSKQLDEENSRLDMIQKLMNVGYVEYNTKTNLLYRSTNAIRIMDRDPSKRTDTLNTALEEAENPEELKAKIAEIITSNGSGEFPYKRKNDPNVYQLKYMGVDGKFYAIIQKM
ncbi:MAG: response regulator [Chitinophagales bacterium]